MKVNPMCRWMILFLSDMPLWFCFQALTPTLGGSSPPDQGKRRLAFDPSPERRRYKMRNKVRGGKTKGATSVSEQPRLRGRPGRATAAMRRTKDGRGKLISLAKARLVMTRQKAKAMARSEPTRTRLDQRGDKVGATPQFITVKASDDPKKPMLLRPRRGHVPRDSDTSEDTPRPTAITRSEVPSGVPTETDGADSGRVGVEHAGSIVMESRIPCQSLPLSRTKTASDTAKGTELSSNPASTAVGHTIDVATDAAISSDGLANAGKRSRVRKQPPAGVTIRP